MLVGIIVLALTAILFICVNKKISSDYSEDVFPVKLLSFLIGFILCAVITLFVSYLNTPITPLDVYKGKTTIQYTIVDGIKTDSCVVWKNDIKK